MQAQNNIAMSIEIEYNLKELKNDIEEYSRQRKMTQTDWGELLGMRREHFNHCINGHKKFLFDELVEIAEIMGKDGGYYIKNAEGAVDTYRALFGKRTEKWRKYAIRAIEDSDPDIQEGMLKNALEELLKSKGERAEK